MAKATKKMSLNEKPYGGWKVPDLLIERDAGNTVGILMGHGKRGKDNWAGLKALCDQALQIIEDAKAG